MAVGRAGQRLQLRKAGHAALERVVALDDPLLLDGQARVLHGRAKVVFARDGRVQLVRPGEKGDLAVAQIDQVMNGRANAGRVVEQNGADLGIVEAKLGQHHGNVAMHQLVEHRLFRAEAQHRHALHLALQHAADAGGQNRGSPLEELTRIS
jgi:hypothetical protein